jgi:hypothetical protein
MRLTKQLNLAFCSKDFGYRIAVNFANVHINLKAHLLLFDFLYTRKDKL